jgi:hypothetical protein
VMTSGGWRCSTTSQAVENRASRERVRVKAGVNGVVRRQNGSGEASHKASV